MSQRIAIIGGGPIGLYLSIKLAENYDHIDLFEKNSWPVDKTCGQGIMPSGISILDKVGIDFKHKTGAYAFDSIKYLDGVLEVQGRLAGTAFGVERKVLSKALFEKASKCSGINLHSDTLVDDIEILKNQKINLMINKQRCVYDYVFICDGLNSRMRELLSFTVKSKKPLRTGARMHFNQKPWSNSVEVYWNEGVEAYVTPVDENKLEVAFLWFKDSIDKGSDLFARLIKKFPELANKLNHTQCSNDFRAYGPFDKYSRGINKGNVFFVGDAYCFLDGITGEGLSLGFKAASILSEHFENFGLTHDLKIKFLYFNYKIWVNLALLMSRSPKIRYISLIILNRARWLFNLILRLND